MYQKYMGAVDKMDKVIAGLGVKLRKNKKRWQRAVFCWLLSAVIHNSTIIMEHLLDGVSLKTYKKDVNKDLAINICSSWN